MKTLAIIVYSLTSLVPISLHSNSRMGSANQEKTHKSAYKERISYFVQFGIVAKDHKNFERKYGVEVHYQNCVISKYLSEKAKENNQRVAKKLTQRFGNSWKKDLGFLPYGV